MSALECLVLALAIVPAVIAIALDVRSRRQMAKLRAELDAEAAETQLRYDAEEEVTQRRYSYSGWPFPNKRPR